MTNSTGCDGERRKAEAIDLVTARREVAIRRIQRAFLKELLAVGEATTDRISDSTPPEIRRACLGAAVNHLVRLKLVEFVRFTVSTRPDRHSCPVRVWRLVDREAAIRWLWKNPDVDVPDSGDGDRGGSQKTLFSICPMYE